MAEVLLQVIAKAVDELVQVVRNKLLTLKIKAHNLRPYFKKRPSNGRVK